MTDEAQVEGLRVPFNDPSVFESGDIIVVAGREYTIQQNQHGEHRVMVTNPDYEPGGPTPRFLYFPYSDVEQLIKAAAIAIHFPGMSFDAEEADSDPGIAEQ